VNNLQSALLPPEQLVIEKAVPSGTGIHAGRTCARARWRGWYGRARFGRTQGQPLWHGRSGSITHTDWYCGAAVRDGRLTALGIDAEPHTPLDDAIVRLILRNREGLVRQGSHPVSIGQILFASIGACSRRLYPLLGVIRATQRHITVDFNARSFRCAARTARKLFILNRARSCCMPIMCSCRLSSTYSIIC